jgi:hypothetical protein
MKITQTSFSKLMCKKVVLFGGWVEVVVVVVVTVSIN